MNIQLQWRLPDAQLKAVWRPSVSGAAVPAMIAGRPGVINLVGPAGPSGPQGGAGNAGLQGPPGGEGAQGPKGDIGDTGPEGLAGAEGEPGPVGPTGPQGSAGAGASSQYIDIGGRWYLHNDNRWVGFSNIYSIQTANFNQTGGIGADPNIGWQNFGPLLLAGSRVTGLRFAGRVNSAAAGSIDIRLYHQTGPWDGTATNNAVIVRNLLLAADNVDFTGTGMHRHIFALDQQISADGYLLMFVRAAESIPSTAYLMSSVAVEWEIA
ncbi:MAG: hypothetical protein V3V15_00910 [Sphingorhabdus sp.]